MKYLLIFLLFSLNIYSQEIPNHWAELTASDWPLALEKSSKTIILPIGVLEKHGPHVPIGSDLIKIREWTDRATKKEYAVIFPDYFYGQVNEARHIQGTFSLPSKLNFELLEATCEEIARNGFNKILIVNGHGGNPPFLRYFIQTQMEKERDYAVYFYDPDQSQAYQDQLAKIRKSDPAGDQHAGERETSALLYMRPDLVQMDRAKRESGANQERLPAITNIYTGIWWYAAFPNHYAGEGDKATKKLGKFITEHKVASIAKAIKAVKTDTLTIELQNKFFDEVDQMTETGK